MPQYRVDITITALNAAAANSLNTLVESRLSSANVARRINNWLENGLRRKLSLHLKTQNQYETLQQWVQTNQATLRTFCTGKVAFHECTHGDPVVLPCIPTEIFL